MPVYGISRPVVPGSAQPLKEAPRPPGHAAGRRHFVGAGDKLYEVPQEVSPTLAHDRFQSNPLQWRLGEPANQRRSV